MKRKKLFSSRSSLASLPECWFGVDPVAGVEHSGYWSAATSAERSVASSVRSLTVPVVSSSCLFFLPASGLTSAQVKKEWIYLLNFKKVSKNPFIFPESRPWAADRRGLSIYDSLLVSKNNSINLTWFTPSVDSIDPGMGRLTHRLHWDELLHLIRWDRVVPKDRIASSIEG